MLGIVEEKIVGNLGDLEGANIYIMQLSMMMLWRKECSAGSLAPTLVCGADKGQGWWIEID